MCSFLSKIAIHEYCNPHTLLTPIVMKLPFKSNMRLNFDTNRWPNTIFSAQNREQKCTPLPVPTARSLRPSDALPSMANRILDYTEYGKGGLRGAKPPLGVRTNHLLSFPAQSLTLQFSAFEKLERLSAPFQSITSHTVFFQKYFRFLTTCPRHEPRFFNVDFLWQILGSRDMLMATFCSVLQRFAFFWMWDAQVV